jgi:glycosyltransferase involved in cell wall biosynthesis
MELLTRTTAEKLTAAGWPVEILTTCIKDFYADWGTNYHQPSLRHENGVAVRRFPVQQRDKATFDALNQQLILGKNLGTAEQQTFINEMFHAPDLYAYMAKNKADYWFICTPYMFPTAYFGGLVAPQRTLHIPYLYDESYAQLELYREPMTQARGLLFLSHAEADLAKQLFGAPAGQWRGVVGMGVEANFTADIAQFRAKYRLGDTPFLLYAGRREASKNVPLLLDYWGRYQKAGRGRGRKLVLIGSGAVPIPPLTAAHVLDLGFVPMVDKYNAYAAATATCQPSLHESFSIVIMESWLAERPVLVNGECAVTQEHVLSANGGLSFTTYEEFADTVDLLFSQPTLADEMGANGRAYAQTHFTWDVVLAKYEALFHELGLEKGAK